MLLTTKFHIPQIPPNSISRQLLLQQLHQGIEQGARLSLIVAPAGYGKTTLISTYLETYLQPVGWLTLDDYDNALSQFLRYFVRSIEIAVRQDLTELRDSLQTVSKPPVESVVHSLINILADLDHLVILVLEDYHVIDNPEVHRALTLILERLPSQAHLIIISRLDPPLPLAKLRVRQQLFEIRTDVLSFTTQECHAFLREEQKLNLSDVQIHQLVERTEGWIAGLHLAGLSLQQSEDVDRFIENFTGSHRYVMDYLMDEVLRHQAEAKRQFLLKTAILRRMNADICNVLLGDTTAQSILEYLEDANLFLIPLDSHRNWYRYHHLFADLLRHRLVRAFPDQVQELHNRAGAWYRDHDYIDDALSHFLAISALDEARQLVEVKSFPSIKRGQVNAARAWIDELPASVVETSPRLLLDQAWIYTYLEQHQNLADTLNQLRELLDGTPVKPARELTALEALSQAYSFYNQGDNWKARTLSQEMLTQLPENEDFIRSWFALLLIYASYNIGEMKDALTYGEMALALCEATGNHMGSLWAIGLTGRVYMLQADDSAVMETYRLALDHASSKGWEYLPYMGTIYQDYGQFLYYANRLEEAEHWLRRGIHLNQQHQLLNEEMEGRLALRQLLWFQGQSDETLTSDEALELLWVGLRQQDLMPEDQILLLAFQARQWLREGQLAAVSRWVHSSSVSLEAIPDYPLDLPQLVLVRYKLSQEEDLDDLQDFLDRYHETVKRRGHTLRLVEAMLLQISCHLKMAHKRQAKGTLEQAISLVAPTELIGLFVEDGEAFAELLLEVRSVAPAFVDGILNAYRLRNKRPFSSLIEPLTEREIEILQLIASGLSNREIAERLFLAVGTVKRHTANIFGKLEVSSRTQAVARARELKLV